MGPYMAIENVQKTFGKKQNCYKWEKDCAFLSGYRYCSTEKSRLTLLNCLGKLIFISNVYGLSSQKVNAKSSKM